MRVVSLCPSITETVFRLGRGEVLVGRTKFCVQPHGLVEAVERVGGTKNPKVARIVELEPDVVLMNEEENRREDADALERSGVRVVSTFARDVDGAVESLRHIAAALHADASAAIAEIEAARAALHARARHVRFAYLIWRDPLMAVGPDTYVDALLREGGGVNVVGGERYPQIELDALHAADRILLSSEPFPFAAKHLDELVEQTQLPRERFALVDGERLSWHGARTALGLAYVPDALGLR